MRFRHFHHPVRLNLRFGFDIGIFCFIVTGFFPIFVKADGFAQVGEQHNVVRTAGLRCADQVIAFFKRDGFNALAADVF